jgi:coproporphyrinogen III oxidase-like Fe-S oxidoreductase
MDAVKQGTHLADTRTLTRVDLPFEFMMNALRLNQGVPAALFEERTGLPLRVCAAALEQASARGLLLPDAARLQPTLQGQHFLNDLLALFLP